MMEYWDTAVHIYPTFHQVFNKLLENDKTL
jgi:hypothetical protein